MQWSGGKGYFRLFGSAFTNTKNGTIRFDYGYKTIKIAGGIDEPEAKYILEKLAGKKLLTNRNFAVKA